MLELPLTCGECGAATYGIIELITCCECGQEVADRGEFVAHLSRHYTYPPPLTPDQALENLKGLTTCRCDPCWTDRKMHEPNSACDYAEDVEIVATELRQLRDELTATRYLLDEARRMIGEKNTELNQIRAQRDAVLVRHYRKEANGAVWCSECRDDRVNDEGVCWTTRELGVTE
jgi:hypothetical protein